MIWLSWKVFSVLCVPWHSGGGEWSKARQESLRLWEPDAAVRTMPLIRIPDLEAVIWRLYLSRHAESIPFVHIQCFFSVSAGQSAAARNGCSAQCRGDGLSLVGFITGLD